MSEVRGSRRQHRAPTISDVAARAGVSPMTVSRVINGESNVRLETRKRVEVAIKALDYAPNSAARTLAGGEEVRIGLLHSNPSFSYLSQLLVGCLDQASKSNIQLLVEKCDDDDEEAAAVEHLMRSRLDGIVLTPPLSESPPVLEVIRERGLPVVAVATGRAPDWALSVSIDERQAAYEMTRHLASLGHVRIGFITGNPRQSASEERLQGYKDALVDAGLSAARELIAQGLFTYRSGLDAAETLLDLEAPPTAIFASNDDMAAASVAVAHQRGLDVPSDLTVCGFDDTALATTIWPELTTVRQPVSDMARMAVELLVREVRAQRAGSRAAHQGADHQGLHHGAEHQGHVRADYQLIRRQSDAAPRRRPSMRRR